MDILDAVFHPLKALSCFHRFQRHNISCHPEQPYGFIAITEFPDGTAPSSVFGLDISFPRHSRKKNRRFQYRKKAFRFRCILVASFRIRVQLTRTIQYRPTGGKHVVKNAGISASV